MADPGFQVGVAEEIGVDQSTVSRTIKEVATKIVDKRAEWISFPSNVREIEIAKQSWQERFSFPCAIGVVDCTHVEIEKPRQHGDEYVNRKGRYTLNVQATCNGQEKFTSVDVSWPGSVHDSRVWRNSDVYAFLIAANSDGVILADKGYGIAPFIMVPYRDPVTPARRSFNTLLAKERVVIERCFGQVKKRFPILMYKNRLSLEVIPKIVVSCFVLHNVAKHLGDDYFDDQDDEGQNEEEDDENADGANNDMNQRLLGQRRRDELAAVIFNNIRFD